MGRNKRPSPLPSRGFKNLKKVDVIYATYRPDNNAQQALRAGCLDAGPHRASIYSIWFLPGHFGSSEVHIW